MNDIIKNLNPDTIALIAWLGAIIVLAVITAVTGTAIYLIGELTDKHKPQRVPKGPWSR